MASSDSPYRVENVGGHAVILLLPELNTVPWGDIERIGGELLARINELKVPSVLVDLSALDYMGSAMVALVVRIWKAVKERDGRMVVVNRDDNVFEVLRLAGLVKVWTIVRTRDEGLAELGYGAGSSSARRLSLLLIAVAVAALVGAGLGLFATLTPSRWMDREPALAVAFVCAAVGLIAGTITGLKETGGRRIFGVAVVLLSLGVIVAGAFNLPKAQGDGRPVADEPAPAA